jgi:predicted ester cyclase
MITDKPMKPEPSQLRDFAERYTAAWCSRDAASVAAFYSPSGSLSINGDAPAIGRRAISDVAQGFMNAFPDLVVVMDDVLVQGDNGVYHWTLAGTNTGAGGTGKRVRISGFEVWKIGADGLIVESRGNFDDALYQHQLNHGIAEPSN